MLLGHIKKKRQKTYNKHLFTIFMFKDKTRGKPDYYRVTTAPPPSLTVCTYPVSSILSISMWSSLMMALCKWSPLRGSSTKTTRRIYILLLHFLALQNSIQNDIFSKRASMAYHTWLHKPDTFFSTASEIDSLTRVTYM